MCELFKDYEFQHHQKTAPRFYLASQKNKAKWGAV